MRGMENLSHLRVPWLTGPSTLRQVPGRSHSLRDLAHCGRSQAGPIAYGILHCTLRLFLSLVCLGLFVGGKFGFRIFLHLNCLKCGHVERFYVAKYSYFVTIFFNTN